MHTTFFDRSRLPEARLWARSARQSAGRRPRPTVLALDKEAERVAREEGCDVIKLRELEEQRPELLEVKRDRHPMGYLLTLKPFLVEVLASQGRDVVCFSDTDCYWWGSSNVIARELDGPAGEVLLAPREQELVSGSYSDGMFAATPRALTWLDRWEALVLDWCEWGSDETSARWGAEKYLDELAKDPQVVVSKHPGIHLAWWNINNHRVTRPDGLVLVDGQPVVCVHYQGLEVGGKRTLWVPQGRRLRSNDISLLYAPYAELLKKEMACPSPANA